MRCDKPLFIENPNYPGPGQEEKIPVPCGKCPPCLTRRVDSWVFRLLQEDKISSSSYFITLTYDSPFLPRTDNNLPTLRVRDLQLFWKRLRKRNSQKIRYYAAGEYGTRNRRPHYHAIVFNLEDPEYVNEAWKDPETGQPLGLTDVGTVTTSSIAYCAKYIDKGKTVPQHARDDRYPEFSRMSKGMGANYLTPAVIRWHKSDLSRCYVVMPGGYRLGLPRYYRDRIYTDEEKAEVLRIISTGIEQSEAEAVERYYNEHPDGNYGRRLASARRARENKLNSKNSKTRLL